MILRNINHTLGFYTEKIVTLFFPLEKIYTDVDGDDEVVIETAKQQNTLSVSAKVYSKHGEEAQTVEEGEDMAMAMSLLLYGVLADITGFRPPWGVLYGVRPARLLHAKTDALGEEGAREFFEKCRVSEKKLALAFEVMHRENDIIRLNRDNSFSLYVSIPFCPSRCSYCSFVSHSIQSAGDLMEPYVALLCRELAEKGKAAKALGLRLESVYFGGGTPTTLNAQQLDMVLSCVEKHFDMSTLREYTVEAGRPDTVTREKLLTLKAHGVERISINPQSFSDAVLEQIGRRHTVQQTLDAFALARACGFDNINMDFIAGLAGDTLENFQHSIDKAVSLGVESITVHNLALKSGAYLVTESEFFDVNEKQLACDMIDYSNAALHAAGYRPYYMYRQSKSLGCLENVGWCKQGYECLYNVFMMDETHTVLAAGAGAVTKLKHPKTGDIMRISNFKYPYEYLRRFEEVLARIQGIYDFYEA